jgi:pimeloyl-ACP methyl ester carboxylesterase
MKTSTDAPWSRSLSIRKTAGPPALSCFEGPTSGSPLLLLHGVGRCAEDYRHFADALVAHWHLFALDFRGHGGSERMSGQYLVTDYARDTADFVREEIQQPVLIYGHSLGAMVALAVAAELPEQVHGVVLEDPPFHTMGQRIAQTPWQALFTGMRDVARRAVPAAELAAALADLAVPVPGGSGLTKLGQVRSEESLRFSAQCLAQLDPEVFTPIIEGRWLNGYDERELYLKVRCPVLLLQGDPSAGSTLTDADADAAMTVLPVCRRIRFAGVGHLIHQDQPAAALRALQEFATNLSSHVHEKKSSLSAVPRV